MKLLLICWLAILTGPLSAQTYTSYLTGNTTDITTTPFGGICMMGGASESDEAMIWFLNRAAGGDILVLRASGSNGYNNYLFSDLGVVVNSVETIVFHSASAASDPYIHQKIAKAEAIWFAGGNQWNYVSYWRGTAIDSLINDRIANKNIAIGGTSAGMAILGSHYFSAQNGTVTSAAALANPYNADVTVDSGSFLELDILNDVITDTHYDDPDRKGRHVVFLARMFQDYGLYGKGIACDEYTAVCINGNGLARVFGEYPTYDDNAYFIRTNCALPNPGPESCSPGTALDWNRGGAALKVYHVSGTINGSQSFDLSDWKTGNGGLWEHWYVDEGVLFETTGSPPVCISSAAAPAFDITKVTNVQTNPVWQEVDDKYIKFIRQESLLNK